MQFNFRHSFVYNDFFLYKLTVLVYAVEKKLFFQETEKLARKNKIRNKNSLSATVILGNNKDFF